MSRLGMDGLSRSGAPTRVVPVPGYPPGTVGLVQILYCGSTGSTAPCSTRVRVAGNAAHLNPFPPLNV
eukprot:841627-Rhodomonas_salina.2